MADQNDSKVYIVIADYGASGRSYCETDVRLADRESIVQDLMTGNIDNPFRVVAFDAAACDVSQDIAEEVVNRSWRGGYTIVPGVKKFCEYHDVDVPEILEDLE